MQGWVKIHRGLLDNELWSDKPFAKGQAWVDLLLMANHKDKNVLIGNRTEMVERGSFITSELKLMERWGWGRKKVKLFLNFLENEKMIERNANNKRTAITIVNYGFYQDFDVKEEQQKDSKRTTKRTTTTVGRSQTIQQSAGRNITLPDRTAQISDLIKQNDPNFSAEDFLSFSRYVYVTIQDAWSKRDLSPVRIYLHDNLYNQTQKQIDRKIANGVINKIENVAVSTAYLTAYRRDKEFEYVTVYLNARLTDYEINEKTGQVLRGDPNARYELRYTLRFARNAGIKTTSANSQTLKSHSCPNCGAPLEMSSSGKCEYCGSTITTGQYSWVLSEYSSIRNDTVDQGIYIEKDNNAQNNTNNNQ